MKVDTIEQFKIKEWVSEHFEKNALNVEYTDYNKAIATDKTGAKMELVCTSSGMTNKYSVIHRFL